MAEPKTKPTNSSVTGFLNKIKDPVLKKECKEVLELMKSVTGEKPKLWGTAIVGFGRYHYVYASGREGDWPLTAFSPRQQNLTLYIMSGFEAHADLMDQLGKFKTGSSCLYLKSLRDVDMTVLKKLIRLSVAEMKKRYPPKK
jgi:hypothetical protein